MDHSPKARARARILVVDDSPTQRHAIVSELSDLDLLTEEAGDGFEALRRINQVQPDLVTLDIDMPALNGDKALRLLKSTDSTMRIPVVMISGHPSDSERHRILELGAIEYFTKPFPVGSLRRLVSSLLDQLAINRDTTVFCLDSEPETRNLLNGILGTHGYVCRVFEDAATLLQALSDQHCDLLLLDLHLEEHQAYRVLEELRERQNHSCLAIVGLTTVSARRDLTTAYRFGVDDFVRKPFFAEELLVRIEHQVRLKQERAHLERIATVDPLTGLHNRREVTRCLEVEVERARRDERDFGVLMIDIDHFKRLNDNYGHPFGDQVLRAVGAVLREEVRMTDVVGRYGGEEFIILCPASTEDGISGIGERIRTRVESLEFETEGEQVRITVSVGGCLWAHDKLRAEPQLESFVKPADSALYRAKRGGRNRVSVVPSALTRSVVPSQFERWTTSQRPGI